LRQIIDKVHFPKKMALVAIASTTVAAFACCTPTATKEPDFTDVPMSSYSVLWEPQSLTLEELEALAKVEPNLLPSNPKPWTSEDVEAMVLTLAGECYEDKPHDKRKVCEVILNRVSSAGFGNTVLEVVSAPNQFNGYWTQSRSVSANDYEVAEQALQDWYDNDCKPFSEYLFFRTGGNRKNQFRSEY